MNFKYLLGALALPALVASCTSEDIVQNNNDSVLEGRRVVGKVNLEAMSAQGGVDSRWAGGTNFQPGIDVIGACLMDLPGGAPTDYISTNYKFAYTDAGEWLSDALFVEGSYYFYMQYNEDMRNRAGLMDTIPAIQYIGESGNDAVMANQLFLGHYDITTEHKDLTVPVLLHGVYAYPRFNFAYEGNNNIVIEKVVFSKPQFQLVRRLNSTVSLGVSYKSHSEAVSVTGTSDKYFAAYQAAVAEGKEVTTINNIVPSMMAGVGEVSDITMVPAKEAASVNGMILMPAGEISTIMDGVGANALTMKIYTNKGIVTAVVPSGTMQDQVYNRPVKNYAATPSNPVVASEYVKVDATKLNTKALWGNEGGAGKLVSVWFKDNAIEVPNALTVNTIEELQKYLNNWYAGKKESIPTLTVTLAKDITLNANVAAFLANTTDNPVVTFTGKTITIPSGLAATVLNTINVSGTEIEIAEGAVQTLSAGVNKTFGKLTNNGTLTIAGDGSNLTAEAYTIANVYNNGTLTVDYSSSLGIVWNMGTVTFNKALADSQLQNGITPKAAGGYNYNNSAKAVVKANLKQINNYATVEFEGTPTITGLYNLKNNISATATPNYIYGTVEVKGGVTTINGGYNQGTIKVSGGNMFLTGDFENEAGSDVAPKFNAGSIEVAAGKIFSTSATLTNNGSVDNDGYFAANASGQIVNSGTLNHGAGTTSLIFSNTATGKIVINEATPAKLTIKSPNAGIIEYTTTDADFYAEDVYEGDIKTHSAGEMKVFDTRITDLIVTKTGNIDLKNLGTSVTDLTINSANADVAFKDAQSLVNLTIQGGEHTIGSVTVTNNLTVASGEIITIPTGSTVAYSATYAEGTKVFTNKGSIFVIGTLNASNYYSNQVVGTTATNGANTIYNNGGNITWKE